MTPQEMYDLGNPIVKSLAGKFYYSNKAQYKQLAIDLDDLEGELYELMCAKYLPTIEKKPDFYSPESFKASFWVGCNKAMLSNVRKHITSQKRGNILRAGIVALDADRKVGGSEGFSVQEEIEEDKNPRYMQEVKQLVDRCEDKLIQRVLFLMACDIYTSKNQVRQRLKMPQRNFETFWHKLMNTAADFCIA